MARLDETNFLVAIHWRVRCPLDLGDASVRLNSALKRLEHVPTRSTRTVAGGVQIGQVRYSVTEKYQEGSATLLRLSGTITEGPDGSELRLLATPSLFGGVFVLLFVAGALYTWEWFSWLLALLVLGACSWGLQSTGRQLRAFVSSAFNADINPK